MSAVRTVDTTVCTIDATVCTIDATVRNSLVVVAGDLNSARTRLISSFVLQNLYVGPKQFRQETSRA